MIASCNDFRIRIVGKGGHAAMPDTSLDPVPIACQMVQGFQTVLTRNKKPIEAGMISATMIYAGESSNVIANGCEIQGTVRTYTLNTPDLIEQRICEIANGVCATFGARCKLDFRRNYSPTVNSSYETAFCCRMMARTVGEENTLLQEPSMGAKDFAYMLQAKPRSYCFIGHGDESHRQVPTEGPCTLHSPYYDFNGDTTPLGTTYWVELATEWLNHPPRGEQ